MRTGEAAYALPPLPVSPRLDEGRLPFDSPRARLPYDSPRARLPYDSPRVPPSRRIVAQHPVHSKPHQPAPLAPASRADVLAVARRLEDGLARGGSAEDLDALWKGVELELLRQVYVHCAERGELLDAVRCEHEGRLANLRRSVARQRAELRELRKELSALSGVGEADSAGGGLDKASTVRRLVEQLPTSERRELVRGLVEDGGGQGETVALLGELLERLDLLDLMQVLANVFHGTKPDEQLRVLHVLAAELEGEQRVQLAAEVAAPAAAEARASLARQLMQALGAVQRQPAVLELLAALPREERLACLESALAGLPLVEFKRVALEHVADLEPDARMGLLSGLAGGAPLRERQTLAQELLVALTADERAPLLTGLLGTMLHGERAALLEPFAHNRGR